MLNIHPTIIPITHQNNCIFIVIGKYGESPKLPYIPGNEGAAEVLEYGKNVKNLNVGDTVIAIGGLIGTWRSHAIFQSKDILKVPPNVDKVSAATATVNPATAFRMLRDFVKLNTGDTVIQNGANSAVGQAAIQLCKIWNLRSVNVIRDRPNVGELKEKLQSLGATEVLTEEEIRTTTLFKSGSLPLPKLGFNCVGGKSATNIMRHLAKTGVLVTYGAMSREPLTIPNAALIFKNIAFRGFWVSQWYKDHSMEERQQMYDELFALMASQQFQPPAHRMISLDQYQDAMIELADIKGMVGEKILFDFTQ